MTSKQKIEEDNINKATNNSNSDDNDTIKRRNSPNLSRFGRTSIESDQA